MGVHRKLEKSARMIDHRFPEESAAYLQHQIVVFTEAQREHVVETTNRSLAMPQLEQRLAEAGERLFVVGLEIQRRLEAPTRPDEFVTRETGVPLPNVQVYCKGKPLEAISNDFESRVIVPFVVEIVRAFAVVVRTEEKVRQWTKLLWRLEHNKVWGEIIQAGEVQVQRGRGAEGQGEERERMEENGRHTTARFPTTPAPHHATAPRVASPESSTSRLKRRASR